MRPILANFLSVHFILDSYEGSKNLLERRRHFSKVCIVFAVFDWTDHYCPDGFEAR